MTLVESVPNVSEGRNDAVISEIARAFGRHGHVLDVHSDSDHHRSVVTLIADDGVLVDTLFAGIARAVELIDLRSHDGIHPRVGAADVVPIVPLRREGMEQAKELARELGGRVGSELGLPVFLYGESGRGLRPAFFRRGGPAELQRRISSGELRPSFGPAVLDPAAGAVLIGARPLLVAFNLDLVGGDLGDAQAIAEAVRGSSGGMPGVQALGLELPGSGRIQVSLNVIDVDEAPLAVVVERVREEALGRGVVVASGELVGLLPESEVASPPTLALAELRDDRVLERRIAELVRDDTRRG